MGTYRATEKLSSAEKWFRDGLLECGLAGSFLSLEVDVSKSAELLEALHQSGGGATWAAVFVKAAARSLEASPKLHQLVAGNWRERPDHIDICLSVSAEQAITPVIVIRDCASRDLASVAEDISRLTPIAREEDRKMMELLNRWGFLGFSSSCRRVLIRFLLGRLWYRKKVSGTFQVTVLRGVDGFAPFRFNTAGAMGVGEVKHRVTVVEGEVAVRLTVVITCCFDHAIWNGGDAALFLKGVKTALENADFEPIREQRSQSDLPLSGRPLTPVPSLRSSER